MDEVEQVFATFMLEPFVVLLVKCLRASATPIHKASETAKKTHSQTPI